MRETGIKLWLLSFAIHTPAPNLGATVRVSGSVDLGMGADIRISD